MLRIREPSMMIRFILFCALASCLPTGYALRAATFVVTTNTDSGPGTFRQALEQANAAPGADVINFDLQGTNTDLHALTPWPVITDPVLIDGYSQPGTQPNTLTDSNNAVIKVSLNSLTPNLFNGKTNLTIN